MNFYRRRFNLYLSLAAALALVSGCALFHRSAKGMADLRVHIESGASLSGATKSISVLRSAPVMVNITTEPVLTEADIITATLITTPDGFAVEVKFDEAGGLTLEQYTATNPGKHLAIFGQWGEKLADGRWLAAPGINRLIANGTLTFTPDASREEAEQLVKGLNIAAKYYAAKKSKE
jgi:preprotein translocase subunit SecD